eukprot:COSAG04_NODE_4814_length_1882_cov_1.231632_1_plen_501_part_10
MEELSSLLRQPPEAATPMRITVGTISEQKFELRALPSDLVYSVKAQISRQAGPPPEQQRIMLAAAELANELSLAECEIEDGARLHMVLKREDPVEPELAAVMGRHGLTQAEQQQLHSEGVRAADTLAALRDVDFEVSEIDIKARRQERLELVGAAIQARHAELLAQQAQALLAEAELSAPARQALSAIERLDGVRELTPERMAELGLGMADRKKLAKFILTERVQQIRPLPMDKVLTEPERRSEERRRQQADVRARREEGWRQASQRPAPALPVSADPGPASTLEELTARHGLTAEDAEILRREGITTTELFLEQEDGDFSLSGIDIKARRRHKLAQDREVAEAAQVQAAQAQVQWLLDGAGLSVQGREALRSEERSLRNVNALRRLDLAAMARLGLKIVDRQILEGFLRTGHVRQIAQPATEKVLTEAEWEAKRKAERARREKAEREDERERAAEEARQAEARAAALARRKAQLIVAAKVLGGSGGGSRQRRAAGRPAGG